MFCTECGVRLPDGARVCPSCGTPVERYAGGESAPEPAPAPEPVPEPVPEPEPAPAPEPESVSAPEPEPTPEPKPEPTPEPAAKSSKKGKAVAVTSVIVLICAILRMCFSLIRCTNSFGNLIDTKRDTGSGGTSIEVNEPPTNTDPSPAPKTQAVGQVPHENVSIDDMELPLSGVFKGSNDYTCHGFLIVTNNTKSMLNISAHFSYKDSTGKELYSSGDSATAVAPGDSVVLVSSYFDEANTLAETSYEITCKKTSSSYVSIKDNFSVEAVSATDKELVVRLTNTGDVPIKLFHAIWLGTDASGYMQGCTCYITGLTDSSLEPGKSLDIEFSTAYLFDEAAFTSWDAYDNWACYVCGFSEASE